MLPPRLSRRSRRKAGQAAVSARQERAKVKEIVTKGEIFFFDLFKDERGDWYKAGGDTAIFYNVLENADPNKIKAIPDIR